MTKRSCAKCVIVLWLFHSVLPLSTFAENARSDSGEPCKQTLTLEEFRAHALNNSPLVAEIDKDFAHELGNAFEKEVLPNPEFQLEQTFTGMKVGGANDSQIQLSVGQSFRISNFGTREQVAELLRKTADLQKRSKLFELLQKLELGYRSLAVLQQTEKIIGEAELRANRKVATIQEGRKKGLLSEGDELLFEGEKYRLQAQSRGIRSSIAKLQNEMLLLGGLRCSLIIERLPAFGELPSQSVLLQKAKENPLGENARAELLTALGREQSRLAELDRYPQLSPRFVYQHTNDGGDFFGAGITIPLPLWNRNQGEQMRSRSEEQLAEARQRFLISGGLARQIENLRESSTNAEEQANIFQRKVIPSFEGALKSQEKLYLEGRGSVLEVWQTLRALNEVQSQGLQLWLETASTRMQLAVLIGEQIS